MSVLIRMLCGAGCVGAVCVACVLARPGRRGEPAPVAPVVAAVGASLMFGVLLIAAQISASRSPSTDPS